MRKGLLLLLSIASTAALGLVAIGGFIYLPQFAEMFEEFGSNVPFITSIILISYKIWWLLPVTTILLGFDVARRKSIAPQYAAMTGWVFIAGFIFAFVLFIVSIWAMYAPVMKAG